MINKGLGTTGLIAHISGHTFMQGRRPTQEDRHTLIHKFAGRKLTDLGVEGSFYAVFDGHSGDQCSDFAAKNLHTNLNKELSKAGVPLTEETVKQCIRKACEDTDKVCICRSYEDFRYEGKLVFI